MVDIANDTTFSQVGYSQRPMNARAQTFNRYLDSCNVAGVVNVPGTAGLSLTTIPLNKSVYDDMVSLNMIDGNFPKDVAQSYNFVSEGKMTRDISKDGGLIIPKDGTYIITLFTMFMSQYADPTYTRLGLDNNIMVGTAVSKKLTGIDGSEALYATQGSLNFIIPMTFSQTKTSALQRGDILYLCAVHKWVGHTYPVIGQYSITKIS